MPGHSVLPLPAPAGGEVICGAGHHHGRAKAYGQHLQQVGCCLNTSSSISLLLFALFLILIHPFRDPWFFISSFSSSPSQHRAPPRPEHCEHCGGGHLPRSTPIQQVKCQCQQNQPKLYQINDPIFAGQHLVGSPWWCEGPIAASTPSCLSSAPCWPGASSPGSCAAHHSGGCSSCISVVGTILSDNFAWSSFVC